MIERFFVTMNRDVNTEGLIKMFSDSRLYSLRMYYNECQNKFVMQQNEQEIIVNKN